MHLSHGERVGGLHGGENARERKRTTQRHQVADGPSGGTLVRRARAGHAPGIFFDPCPTGDLLGGALSAVRAQCNYLDG